MKRNDDSFEYYDPSDDENFSPCLGHSDKKQADGTQDGVGESDVPGQQRRSSAGSLSGDEENNDRGLPDVSLENEHETAAAYRQPENLTSSAPAADSERAADHDVPRAGLRRALSYGSGLADLTQRVVRQMQEVVGSGDDEVLEYVFGNASSSSAAGMISDGGPSPAAGGVENNTLASINPPEDRSRAAAALARIQNRRAGNAGGGCRGGDVGIGRRRPQPLEQRQKDGGCAGNSGVDDIAKKNSHRRRRSFSEPPRLPPRARSLAGGDEEGNDKIEGGRCHSVKRVDKRNDGRQKNQPVDKTEAVALTETVADAEQKRAATAPTDVVSSSTSCASLDLDTVLRMEDEISAKNSTASGASDANRTMSKERPATFAQSFTDGTNGVSGEDLLPKSPSQSQSELESRALAQNFVMEHRIFLRAILQLLAERDQYAIEADANDPHTIKVGPLKKASHLVRGVWKWKVKYVEIRKGLFSYYEDSEGGLSSSFHMGGGGSSRRSSLTPAVDGDEDEGASPAGSGGEDNGVEKMGSAAAPELRRKSIPLRAATCTCRAVKVSNKALSHTPLSPSGAIFELTVEGGPRRLWMCTTREERQAWIHAIHEAMIGGSVTRGDNFLEYQVERKRDGSAGSAVPARSPYRNDLERYLQLQGELRNAKCKSTYVGALADLCSGTESLNVPVQWIKERIEVSSTGSAPSAAFVEGGVSSGVAQLWKDMLRDSVSINGDVYTGDGGHGPERIVGALTKCIMNFDRSATQNVNATRSYRKKFGITESQAISYARDVLLACNRTRSGGDSYYCMDNLCSNDLVVLCPSSSEAEPLRVTVRHAMNDDISRRGSNFHGGNDMSGWLQTKSGSQKSWKKRFGVLSEGVLSYYEQAHPRPHGLRGQLLLAGATMGVSQVGGSVDDKKINEENAQSKQSEQESYKRIRNRMTAYIVCIISKDRSKERQIRFDDQMEFFLWNQAFRDAIQSSGTATRGDRMNDGAGMAVRPTNSRESQGIVSLQGASALIANRLRGLSVLARDGATSPLRSERWRSTREAESGECVAQESADANSEQDKSSADLPTRSPSTSQLEKSRNVRSTHWKKVKGGRARSTVEIAVQNSAVYKICTTDPQGDDRDDTWAMLQTNFLQNFRLSGGPNGRIMRGEEIVQLNFLEGLVADDAFDRVFNKADKKETITLPRCASSIDYEG